MEIDFVITWVDMDDPAWQEQFSRYSGGGFDDSTNSKSKARFRDGGLLRYWFRGVEKFTPWVRTVHFVTCGQKPSWLREDHPKLHLVSHSDFIPEEFLPTFNSSNIEMFFHRIPSLSDRFVYFNDDFYPISPIPEERFFGKEDGLPRDIAVFRLNTSASLWSRCLENNIRLINSRFEKKAVQKEFASKWFTPEYEGRDRLTRLLRFYPRFITLKIPHNAQPYLKKTYQDVWEAFGDEILKVAPNRFRTKDDYTQELFRTWQICQGDFVPYNTYKDTRMFPLLVGSDKAIDAVRNQSYRLVCLNDNAHIRDYDNVMKSLGEAFEGILPDKSSFEKS